MGFKAEFTEKTPEKKLRSSISDTSYRVRLSNVTTSFRDRPRNLHFGISNETLDSTKEQAFLVTFGI